MNRIPRSGRWACVGIFEFFYLSSARPTVVFSFLFSVKVYGKLAKGPIYCPLFHPTYTLVRKKKKSKNKYYASFPPHFFLCGRVPWLVLPYWPWFFHVCLFGKSSVGFRFFLGGGKLPTNWWWFFSQSLKVPATKQATCQYFMSTQTTLLEFQQKKGEIRKREIYFFVPNSIVLLLVCIEATLF